MKCSADEFVIFDLDFTLINSFTRGFTKWNELSKNYYCPRECDFVVDHDMVWIRPGIEETLRMLKSKGYRLLFWTSRHEVHAKSVLEKLPFSNLFEAFYFGDQGITTPDRYKSIQMLKERFYPYHEVSQFFLVDDDEENAKVNPYNTFTILSYTEWGFFKKESYDEHIMSVSKNLEEMCKAIEEHFE
jgi:hydroxymethylpyrimidine pyrophosphatase-like HAD family hydrolase